MDSNENKKTFEEGMNEEHGMDANCQKSEEKDREEECRQQKANASEGQAAQKEEKGSSGEVRFVNANGTADGENTKADPQNSKDFSEEKEEPFEVKKEEQPSPYGCSYTPPYYVPNFTVVDPKEKADQRKEKRQKKIFLLCAVVSVALAACVGVFVGVFLARFYEKTPVKSPTNQSVNVTKNDGSIVVNEIVGSTGYDHLSVAEVVELVADSVVEITTSQVQTNPFWGNFVKSGAGSGVIIDPNGYIITNNHVIENATSVTVRLTSGAEYTATVLGGDADSDIAVLKIEATELRAAVLGKSTDLKVGQDVVAIGNPLGELGGTVTNGIISAMDRQVIVDGHPMTLLQTNAAINPGNSGGGLFNMAGELVGIVNAKQSDTGIEGLGFAIPIDVAWKKASDLMQYGYVTGKILLEFSVEAQTSAFYVQDGGGFFANKYQFPAGVYVVSSENDSLKKYDRIMSVNGITVNSISDFYQAIQGLVKGDELKLVISRLDTSGLTAQFREHTVTMTVKVTEPTA